MQVSDDNGGTASVEVVITVTNVPEGLSAAPSEVEVSLSGNTFTVTWGEVSGANEYEAQYRKDASEDWTSLEAVISTSTAYTAAGVLNCGTTYDFQVRSHGDGETHLADWGEFSAPVSELVETDTCNNVPAFGEESYAFSIAEDAALDAAVGSVSATDDDTGDTLTYAFTDEDTVEKFNINNSTGDHRSLDKTTPSYTLRAPPAPSPSAVQLSTDNHPLPIRSACRSVFLPSSDDNGWHSNSAEVVMHCNERAGGLTPNAGHHLHCLPQRDSAIPSPSLGTL